LKGDSGVLNAKRTVKSDPPRHVAPQPESNKIKDLRFLLLKSDGSYDTGCFHAQQAAEKYLKAILTMQGLGIPRTYELEELQIIYV